MVDSTHKVILSSGRFSGTSRAQLAAAFDAFSASPQKDTLVVHFHGGLVSQSDAEGIAARLLPVYQAAGAHPLFVIWQAGFGETLRNNWREIVTEDVFPLLVNRVLQFAIGKIDQDPGEKGAEVELPTRFAVADEIQQKQAVNAEPYADREAEAAKVDSQLTAIEQQQFEELLKNDGALSDAAIKLNRPGAPELQPDLKAELDGARKAGEPGEKALLSTAMLVAAGTRILARTLKRFATGRGHGVYTTVVEEVARELKGDLAGGIVWKHMKKDTADSFDGPGDTHGGAALLAEIERLHKAGRKPRIVLIGHSTGAVYICHLLQQAAAKLPADVRFQVVFLAPACSFQLFSQALVAGGNRVAAFRSFGMQDALEAKDAIFPPIYLRSLLYLVSGLLEDSVDLPLVGMQRFHTGKAPFHSAEITGALKRLEAFPAAWIWSDSRAGAGQNTLSHKHGDFDNDQETLASVGHLIQQVIV